MARVCGGQGMRVLIACEFSGIVRDAFIAEGYDAISCDLLPTERPGPHVQGDVTPLLRQPWDMVIAHPPCNYLTTINHLFSRWETDTEFWGKCASALDFFVDCYRANAPMVAVENPQPMPSVLRFLGPPQDKTCASHFGAAYKKRTLLWTRGLPPLMRTAVNPMARPLVSLDHGNRSTDGDGKPVLGHGKDGHRRSRFHLGMAGAMAKQWGGS